MAALVPCFELETTNTCADASCCLHDAILLLHHHQVDEGLLISKKLGLVHTPPEVIPFDRQGIREHGDKESSHLHATHREFASPW